jgi:hypothetical protein
MSQHEQIIEYDKLGRVLFLKIPNLDITYSYKYLNNKRVCEIVSYKNKSNYKTTSFQELIDNKYVDNKLIQIGETYDIEITYDKFGREVELKRLNKRKDTKYKKTTFRNSKGLPLIWIEEYNEIKTLGFKVEMEKINS